MEVVQNDCQGQQLCSDETALPFGLLPTVRESLPIFLCGTGDRQQHPEQDGEGEQETLLLKEGTALHPS